MASVRIQYRPNEFSFKLSVLCALFIAYQAQPHVMDICNAFIHHTARRYTAIELILIGKVSEHISITILCKNRAIKTPTLCQTFMKWSNYCQK